MLGPPVFEADRAYRTIHALSVRIGPREDSDPRFVRSADLIASAFSTLGYTVTRPRIPIPAGRSEGRSVPAGFTQNVLGRPPGFDGDAPHLLVGAHLDTVAGTPGANDNASGVAVMMEMARLARLLPTRMPVVWVAFGGEERRLPGASGATFGSRHYLAGMTQSERKALRGVIVIDVVGKGSVVNVCSEGITKPAILDALTGTAQRLGIASRRRTVTRLFSDHRPFERTGYPVGWLWTGSFSQVHTPRDTIGIIQRDALDRTGRVAWETVRTLSL